jgi:hypothetical protein
MPFHREAQPRHISQELSLPGTRVFSCLGFSGTKVLTAASERAHRNL